MTEVFDSANISEPAGNIPLSKWQVASEFAVGRAPRWKRFYLIEITTSNEVLKFDA